MVHLDQEVMGIYLLAMKGIVRGALDGISVGRSSTAHEVRDTAVLVTLIVINGPGENHETGTGARLTFLKQFRQVLFCGAGRVAAAKLFLIGRAGIWRMVEHEKHKVHVGRDVIEFAGEPLALRTLDLVDRAIGRSPHSTGA